jgi:hypothetical protein
LDGDAIASVVSTEESDADDATVTSDDDDDGGDDDETGGGEEEMEHEEEEDRGIVYAAAYTQGGASSGGSTASTEAAAAAATAGTSAGGGSTDFISSLLVSAYEMSENAKKGEQRLQRMAILDELDGWMGGGKGGGSGSGSGSDSDDEDSFLPRLKRGAPDSKIAVTVVAGEGGDAVAGGRATSEESVHTPVPPGVSCARSSSRARRNAAAAPVRSPRGGDSGGGDGGGDFSLAGRRHLSTSQPIRGGGGGAHTLADAPTFQDQQRAEYYARAMSGGGQRAMSSGGLAALETLARAATPVRRSPRPGVEHAAFKRLGFRV